MTDGRYRAVAAERSAVGRRARPKPARLAVNAELREVVQQAGLTKKWSPEQISRALRREFAGRPEMHVSRNDLPALYVQGRGVSAIL